MTYITIPCELVEHAINAFETDHWLNKVQALKNLREALSQQVPPELEAAVNKSLGLKQEPVAHITGYFGGRCVIEPPERASVFPVGTALYVQPHQSQMPLNDEQLRDALRSCPHDTVENLRVRWLYAKDFARAIEAAHGIGVTNE